MARRGGAERGNEAFMSRLSGHFDEIIVSALAPILTGLIFCLVTVGLGMLALRLFIRENRPPLFESFALGALVIALVTMIFGTFGWLGPVPRLILGGVIILLGAVGWFRYKPALQFDPQVYKDPVAIVLAVLIVVGIVLPIVFVPLAPPTAWDECSYHLPGVLRMLETGRDTFRPDISLSNTPRNAEMLFFWAVAWSPLSSVHYVNFLAYIFIILAVVRLGSLVFSEKVGLLAALLLGAYGHLQWLAVHGKTDIWVFFFMVAALLAGAQSLKTGSSGRMLLTGAFLGAAVGTKYTGLTGIMALLIAFILLRIWGLPEVKPVSRKVYLYMLLVAVAIASPWYIRNIIWFNNPIFPFGTDIFPAGGGTYGYYAQEAAIDSKLMVTLMGMGYRTSHGLIIVDLIRQWVLWGVIVAGFPFWRRSPFLRLVIIWSVINFVYWMFGMGGVLNARYYIYFAAFTVLAFANLACLIYSKFNILASGKLMRNLAWIILVVFIGAFGIKGAKGMPPLVQSERLEYVSREVNSYNLMAAANTVIPADATAVGIMCEDGRLYADFILLGGIDIGWASHEVISRHTDSAESLARFLKERYGAGWLVVNTRRLNDETARALFRIKLPYDDLRFSEFFLERVKIDSGVVYQINTPQ